MIDIYWAGWFKDAKSDKIWGILKSGNAYYNFWGKRGKRMQFKRTADINFCHKASKGYNELSLSQLEAIHPNFREEAESALVFKVMADQV